jgi:hypothetical protein
MTVEEIDAPEFEKYLDGEFIFVKARGEVEGALKIFAYSNETSTNSIFLVELNLDFPNQEVNYTIKSQKDGLISKYEEYLLKVIDPIL